MYQLQNIDYLYRISTMTGSSKLVTTSKTFSTGPTITVLFLFPEILP